MAIIHGIIFPSLPGSPAKSKPNAVESGSHLHVWHFIWQFSGLLIFLSRWSLFFNAAYAKRRVAQRAGLTEQGRWRDLGAHLLSDEREDGANGFLTIRHHLFICDLMPLDALGTEPLLPKLFAHLTKQAGYNLCVYSKCEPKALGCAISSRTPRSCMKAWPFKLRQQ